MRAAGLLLLALGLASDRAAVAAPADPLSEARRAHADRLAALGAAAQKARLGRLALRCYEDAHALHPEAEAPRLALGWTRAGATWREPTALVVPGEGWPDDGDADAARFARRLGDASQAHVKDLLAAATAARARRDPATAERLLWAAVAVAPDDEAPRLSLGHTVVDGRFLASEHAALARGAPEAREAWAREARRAASSSLPEPVEPPRPQVAGWPRPVGPGRRAATGDAAFSLDEARSFPRSLSVPAAASAAGEARALVAHWLGAPLSRRAATLLLAPGRDVADTLLAADADTDPTTRAAAHRWPVWPLGKTGYDLVVAPTTADARSVVVDTFAQREAVGRAQDREGLRWVAFGAGCLATHTLLGAPAGYATQRVAVAGDPFPRRRPGESLPALLRRLVATGADRPLRALASADARTLLPPDAAKAGSLLEFLLRRDLARARGFLGVLAGPGERAPRLDAACQAAGFADAEALDEAWRRFVADAAPRPDETAPSAASRDPWKVIKTKRVPPPDVPSLSVRREHAVAGSLWLGGRPYLCRPAQGGASVELEPATVGGPPRVVKTQGPVSFSVPREHGGGFVEVRVDLRAAAGSTSTFASAADAFAASVEGVALVFVDADLDGRISVEEGDGVSIDGGPLLPLRRELVVGRRLVEVRRVGPDGREMAFRSRLLAIPADVADAFAFWNAVRAASGLAGLVPDPALLPSALPAASDATTWLGPVRADASLLRDALARGLTDPAGLAVLLHPLARHAAFGAVGPGATPAVVARVALDVTPVDFHGPVIFPGAGSTSMPADLVFAVHAPGLASAGPAEWVATLRGPGGSLDLQRVSAGPSHDLWVWRAAAPLARRSTYTWSVRADADAGAASRDSTSTFVTD